MAKISKFEQFSFTESMIDDFINSFGINESSDDDSEVIQDILNKYNQKFGDKKPSHQEFADFYHDMRSQGYDGILIFDTLEDVIPNPEQEEEKLPDSAYKRIEKKVLSDLKLDTKLVFTFGAGIGALYPVVQEMMANLSLSGVEMTQETSVLLTIACITIVYLEEKKAKTPEEEEKKRQEVEDMNKSIQQLLQQKPKFTSKDKAISTIKSFIK